MARKTQKQKVLDYLRSHSYITSLVAFGVFKITRLSAVIYDLKAAGYKIDAEPAVDAAGGRYTRYSLVA
jgi:hypothetical protein